MKERILTRRAIFVGVGIVTSLGIIALFLILLSAQERPVVVSPPPAEPELARVLEGPDPNAIYLQLQAGGYEIVDASRKYIHRAKGEVIVQMEGFPQDDSPGDPALPYQVYHIALPPEAVANSLRIEVIHLAEKELPGEYHIAPAPPYLLDQEVPTEEELHWEFTQWDVGKEIVEGRNVLIYEKDAFYPAEYCQAKSGGQLRKWKVATIVYYPVRYNPVKSKLVMAEQVGLKISFDRDYTYLKQKKTKELLRDDTFDDRAQKLFLNYDRAKDWYLQPLREGSLGKDDSIDPNFAIITTEDIYTSSVALDDFCFHKQDLGFTVIVVTEHQTHTVVGSSGSYSFVDAPGGYEDVVGEPPNQRPQKIRQWLMDNYLALDIEYVLLIGNPDPDNIEPDDLVGDVPMQLCWLDLLSDYPTDLYLSDLSGDWNLDDDDYVGEKYPAGGYSNLPAGVTENLFCVRWEGVVEVAGATDPVYGGIYGATEGQTKIWLDRDNDGFNDADIILDDTTEHHPEYQIAAFNLADGHYPIRVEYTQSSGDAYCNFLARNWTTGVTTTFKHDDGTGTFVDQLEADYFNDNDFSPPPDVERLDYTPDVQFIVGGDRDVGGVDFYPEVIIGRIPCYDEDEDGNPDYTTLDAILNKIIAYENANIHEETWRRRALISTPYMYSYDDVPGYETADYKGGEYLMCNIAPPPLWEWTRIHDEDYGDELCDKAGEVITPCNDTNTVTAWNDPDDPNDGQGVVMWRTHGSQTGASHVFEETRCADLDDSKPSIVIQTTCQNGHPEVEEWYEAKRYPLGYSLLKRGAVATISSSRNSAGGLFDPTDIDISHKNNPYLCYFLARGIFDNLDVGEVLAHVRKDDATLGRWWGNIFEYNLYGDPSLSLFGEDPAYKSDVVFLLDGSGSMVSPETGKWQAAVDATVLFYDLMKALRHPTFEDRYNSVVFRWLVPGYTDGTTTVPPGTGMKDMSVPLEVSTFNPTFVPEPSYMTPMGLGLQLAANQFVTGTEESLYTDKIIILLSDGKHNVGTHPLTVTQAAEWPGSVRVFSVGLGEDDIEPETIEHIADATYGDYRISPSPREIEGFFCEIFCDLSWKLQDVTVVTSTAAIDQSKAVFIVVWDDPAATLSFDLNLPNGSTVTPTDSGAYCTYHPPATSGTHAFYVCEGLPTELLGDWHFVNINDGGTPVPLSDVLLKVIGDPQTIADFGIENVDHYTGQPIILTAKITEDRRPKTGLTEVYAELIRSPALAVGTLMAENSPSLGYPRQPSTKADRTLRNHYLLGVMKKLGIERLSQVGGPKIYLHDDGLGGDLKADDGIYTGVFNDTQYEGSYTFKFRARGRNRDGVTFDRTETLSEYVKFAASPTETEVEFVSVVADQQEKIVRATIRVTPRDAFGSYLGPFRGDPIRLWSSAGNFKPEYYDNKDGSYSFTLIYPIDAVPLVSVSVGDVIVAEQAPVEVEEAGLPIWVFLVLLLLVVLILVICLYLIARRGGRT